MPLISWLLGLAGKLAGGSLLSWLAPLAIGAGGALGTILRAIAEIILALAKSPEGRVVLFLAALGCTGLYGRYHYIQQGRAEGRAVAQAETSRQVAAALTKQKKAFKCPARARRQYGW